MGVDFEPPWSEQIGALKFQQQPAAALSLARILAKAVRAQRLPAPDLIVPVLCLASVGRNAGSTKPGCSRK